MKKLLLIVTIIFFSVVNIANADPELRNYDGIEVPAGTFIPIISLQQFSTATSDETTPLKFASTNDIYLFETDVIPTGTVFYGHIEKKNEPIVGTNASMVVRITKMKLQDGFEIPLKGYIYTTNGNLIGGEMTEPETYDKVPHYAKGICHNYIGVLQYVPGATRKMGEHVSITSGASLLIELTGPAYITHTLNNWQYFDWGYNSIR